MMCFTYTVECWPSHWCDYLYRAYQEIQRCVVIISSTHMHVQGRDGWWKRGIEDVIRHKGGPDSHRSNFAYQTCNPNPINCGVMMSSEPNNSLSQPH